MSIQTFKRWVFWAHLATGLVAGLFVFGMSFSGALLTYERQIKELTEMSYTVPTQSAARRIDTDQVVERLQQLHPEEPHIYVRWVNREGAAIPAWSGRHSYLIHPYSGDILREGQGLVGEFFHIVTDFHRYLLLEGNNQTIGKNITAYANLVFIFLIISGLYLWLPKRFTRKALKQQALLPKQYTNTQHRNRSWHFVFGIWSLPFLFVIALTATIFHFDWANKAIYGLYGQSVPQREHHQEVTNLDADIVSYESLFIKAQQHAAEHGASDWHSMWMEIGEDKHEARFFIDRSIGNRHELAYSLFFDTRDGQVTNMLAKADWSKGDQAWNTARFLHTGEYLGFVGQTFAGIVSILACFLVYTGIVLAWRRLVKEPQLRKARLNKSNGI